MFQPLNLPSYPFKIKEENGTAFIFDEIRRKHLVLTPEEWVRQHFVKYLSIHKKYPAGLIKLEGGLRLNTLQKRSDIVAYNSLGEKILLVECKAPAVQIKQHVFDQAARYNTIHRVNILIVTNGIEHYVCKIDHNKKTWQFIDQVPEYGEL